MAHPLRAWAINRGEKNSVRNLRYSPQTRLVRGMSVIILEKCSFSLGLKGVKPLEERLCRSMPLINTLDQHLDWYKIDIPVDTPSTPNQIHQ